MTEEERRLAQAHGCAGTFRFGDGPELNAALLALVKEGRKTATCFAHRDVASGREWMPQVGDRSLGLTWDGRPAVVIETVEVSLRRFDEVDEAFALAEGEDADLEGWRAGHRAYFERTGGFSPGMMLVCERFRLVSALG